MNVKKSHPASLNIDSKKSNKKSRKNKITSKYFLAYAFNALPIVYVWYHCNLLAIIFYSFCSIVLFFISRQTHTHKKKRVYFLYNRHLHCLTHFKYPQLTYSLFHFTSLSSTIVENTLKKWYVYVHKSIHTWLILERKKIQIKAEKL